MLFMLVGVNFKLNFLVVTLACQFPALWFGFPVAGSGRGSLQQGCQVCSKILAEGQSKTSTKVAQLMGKVNMQTNCKSHSY